jgi:hypothetical protein
MRSSEKVDLPHNAGDRLARVRGTFGTPQGTVLQMMIVIISKASRNDRFTLKNQPF